MSDKVTDDLIQEIVELEEGAAGEEPGHVIRYALAVETLKPGEDLPGISVYESENLTSWGLRGLAWVLERQASDQMESES